MCTRLLAFVWLCSGRLAFAVPALDPGPVSLESGRIRHVQEIFEFLDLDGDGFLSLDEFLAAPIEQLDLEAARARFEQIDQDRDGRLSLEEVIVDLVRAADPSLPR